jgi:hypothetical protein
MTTNVEPGRDRTGSAREDMRRNFVALDIMAVALQGKR